MKNNYRNAFLLGLAFALGLSFAKGATAADSSDDDKVKFRTLKGGLVVAIKEGKVVGGAGASVGQSKTPTFSFFEKSEEVKHLSKPKRILRYLDQHIRPSVESLRHPKGMPPDCEAIEMGRRQQGELLAHCDSEKLRVLPYIEEVYREGSYTTSRDYKHPDKYRRVIYTKKDIKIGSKTYEVTLVSKQRIRDGGYIQYGVTKVSEKTAKDSGLGFIYSLEEIRVKERS